MCDDRIRILCYELVCIIVDIALHSDHMAWKLRLEIP